MYGTAFPKLLNGVVFQMFFDWLGALPGAAAQGMIWGIMAIGVYITYKILDIADLTVDGSICTGGAVCAILVVNGVNVWLAMLVAVIAGLIAGLVTGILHTFMGIPSILAGILTQLMLWSVNLKIMGKANIALPIRNYKLILAQINSLQSILTLVIFVCVTIAVLYWFFGREIGAALRSTGNNIAMSRAQGINTDLAKILGLVISNGIVALSGALLSQYQGFADINMGRGAIVIGLAAVVIGEAVVSKLPPNFAIRLAGVIVGGIIYYVVYQTVIFLGLDAELLKMLSALVVAVFLALPYWRKKFFSKSTKAHSHKGGKENA